MSSDWIDFVQRAGILKTGDFRLKSGKHSPYFMNFGCIDSGATLSEMGRHFAQAILDWDLQPDLLFGPAYKGLPMAVATAIEYTRLSGRDLPYGSFRKEAKQHGDAGLSLGRAPYAGARIVMIDDVLTTSATKLEAIQEIGRFLGGGAAGDPGRGATGSPTGVNIVAVVVGVDRLERTPAGNLYSQEFTAQTGIPLKALSTTRELLDGLHQRGHIEEATYRLCLEAL